jgi:steroid delta-isomerase-like uncharacterized protein
MSTENNKALVLSFYDAINSGDLDEFDDLISDDFIEHEEFPGLPTKGPAAVKEQLAVFKTAFPDLQMKADDVLADGDRVVVRGTMTGTHRGEFMGTPPTNKNVDVQFIDIIEIHDGKATEHWGITDGAALMQQLGLVEM